MAHIKRFEEFVKGTSQTGKMPLKFMFRQEENGDILAVFDEWLNKVKGEIMCYSHVGQHSGCTKEYVENNTVEPKLDDCSDLLEELKRIGYDNLRLVHSLDDFTIFQ